MIAETELVIFPPAVRVTFVTLCPLCFPALLATQKALGP